MATGRLNYEPPLEVGDRIEIGGRHGIISTIEPVLREHELHLVVQLSRDRSLYADIPNQNDHEEHVRPQCDLAAPEA